MTTALTFSAYAARLRQFMAQFPADADAAFDSSDEPFNALALDLFALQYEHNILYRRLCVSSGASPATVSHWTGIPTVPTSAFKDLELTSLPPTERTTVFHSSGTTGQRPSRHFHSAESLALYEASLLPWFEAHLSPDADKVALDLLVLTPDAAQAPCSSLVHMFEAVQRKFAGNRSTFCGTVDSNGAWSLDLARAEAALAASVRNAQPLLVLGTAFNFVHLLDPLVASDQRYKLPPGSRVLETGGYKGRSRSMPKTELHSLIAERLGVARESILCEYGMSELSSQGYDSSIRRTRLTPHAPRAFRFPPWARVRIVSPETGREVADGETGLIQVFDLANAWSVLAVQTEDLAIRRGRGFEVIGRAATAEPRGCSLMTA